MSTHAATATVTEQHPSKALHVTLWVAQAVLAAAFLAAGGMKTMQSSDALAAKMAWMSSFPPAAVRAIGVLELLGGLGLILPAALRIAPRLTAFAAAGLTALMIGAAGTHIVLGQANTMAPSVVLGALAAFVAWGRFRAAPIAPRA